MSEHTCTYIFLFHRAVPPSKKKEGDETKEIPFNHSNKAQFETQIREQAGLKTSMDLREQICKRKHTKWRISVYLRARIFDELGGPLQLKVPGSISPQRLSNEVSLTTYDAVSRTHDINSVTCDVRNCDTYNLLVRLCRPNTDLSLSTSQNQVWTATVNTYTG